MSRGWLLVVCLMGGLACTRQSGLPQPGSDVYRRLCAAFYLGLSALQSGEDVNSRRGLTEATQIAPEEPAGWLNLGLLQFRQQDFEGAYASVSKALTLVSNNSRVEALLGVIESRRGKQAECLQHLRRATELDGHNLKAAFALAQETERQGGADSDAQAAALLERILQVEPNNLAVLVEDVRLTAKRGDAPHLRESVKKLVSLANEMPPGAQEQLHALEAQASGSDVRPAAIQIQFLKNTLVRAPSYRQSLDRVRTPAISAGEPFLKFFRIPSPRSTPDAPDMKLTFQRILAAKESKPLKALGVFFADSEHAPIPLCANLLHLAIPGEVIAFAPADFNYDFKTDLLVATTAGLRLFQQESPDRFRDVTPAMHLPKDVAGSPYTGAWAFDFDGDGDLDIVLGRAEGDPPVLRNNGDGTFKPVHPFTAVHGAVAFTSGDFDGDGDPDVAFLDGSQHLVVLRNQRLGDYQARPVPPNFASAAKAITTGDVDGDGLPDLVVTGTDGTIRRLSDQNAGENWTGAILGHGDGGSTFLTLADLDNNGALDIISGKKILLGDGHEFHPLSAITNAEPVGVADMNEDGLLDLIGADGALYNAQSISKYRWQTVRPKAATTNGDQRINSFAIGGEIELRADLLTQKQIIREPQMHFGMGSHNGNASFVRIVWPNGLIQTEFNLKPDGSLLAEQRLKGSCPFLYAWNGRDIKFVKDVAPMSAALGAHSPAAGFAPVGPAREQFQIAADQLQARNGAYDLRVTDEYWETYYIDQYELSAADHPTGTYFWVDERVSDPPVRERYYLTSAPRDFARIEAKTFGMGAYRGVVQDHWTTLELPVDTPRDQQLVLIAQGWLAPWDDSTLMALGQSKLPKAADLSLEVPDGRGGWRTAQRDLGVPAGRNKTLVIGLNRLWAKGSCDRRFRLRTNLAIHWTGLHWAIVNDSRQVQMQRATLDGAELRPRGFSRLLSQAPETPDYHLIAWSGPRWHAIEGFYTRYGDVHQLVAGADERFVVMGSGDELRLRFHALPPPGPGTVRDFIFTGDGWLKEGDLGFQMSRTVLPLPYRGMRQYKGDPESLEEQPAYRKHREDWREYHTRWMSDDLFSQALVSSNE